MDKFDKAAIFGTALFTVAMGIAFYLDAQALYPRVNATVTGVTQPSFLHSVKTYLVCDEGHTVIARNKVYIVGTKYTVTCRQHSKGAL
tara:strand:- start:4012 stop:4275 length:264 start_codon:yes stop_codon:yes gene_type:complete